MKSETNKHIDDGSTDRSSFVKKGFIVAVTGATVTEKQLGIYELAQFTPKV